MTACSRLLFKGAIFGPFFWVSERKTTKIAGQ